MITHPPRSMHLHASPSRSLCRRSSLSFPAGSSLVSFAPSLAILFASLLSLLSFLFSLSKLLIVPCPLTAPSPLFQLSSLLCDLHWVAPLLSLCIQARSGTIGWGSARAVCQAQDQACRLLLRWSHAPARPIPFASCRACTLPSRPLLPHCLPRSFERIARNLRPPSSHHRSPFASLHCPLPIVCRCCRGPPHSASARTHSTHYSPSVLSKSLINRGHATFEHFRASLVR